MISTLRSQTISSLQEKLLMELNAGNHPDLMAESNNDQPREEAKCDAVVVDIATTLPIIDYDPSRQCFIRKATKKRGPIYGEIPGIKPGHMFTDKKDCYQAGVHGMIFRGIHGRKGTGAYSVCLSGVYPDNVDDGEFIIYTGTGGQVDSFRGDHKQIAEQTLNHPDNAALLVSADLEQPVRVVRKECSDSKWAPASGCRYDGLYLVEKAYLDKGVSGHLVCRFEMRRLPGQPPIPKNPYFEGAGI